MNIKKKEVVVTAFEESPLWKYFRSSQSFSLNTPQQSIDSTKNNNSQTTASRATVSEMEQVVDHEGVLEEIVEVVGEDSSEEFKGNISYPPVPFSRVPSHTDKPMLTISLLDPIGDLEELSRSSRNNSISGITKSDIID